jgi:hypothetical protein
VEEQLEANIPKRRGIINQTNERRPSPFEEVGKMT